MLRELSAVQTHGSNLSELMGLLGTVLFCVAILPQILANHRKKSTEGLPLLMMMIWSTGAAPFAGYAFAQNFAWAVKAQAEILFLLETVCVGQILYFSHHFSKRDSVLLSGLLILIVLALEVAFYFICHVPYTHGNEKPAVAVGVISAIMFSLGILPVFPKIYKRRGRVVGIDFVFLTIDASAAVLSLLAVIFQEIFDLQGFLQYSVLLFFELLIFASQGIWLIHTHHKCKRIGITHKEYVAQLDQRSFERIAARGRSGASVNLKKQSEAFDFDLENPKQSPGAKAGHDSDGAPETAMTTRADTAASVGAAPDPLL